MLILRKEALNELTGERTGPCISIYLPTEKGSIETKQNPVRYRKLVRAAQRKLAAVGLKNYEINSLMAPALPLLDDSMFWQYQSGGLAVFLSSRIRRAYTLPANFTEMAAVGDRFCVKQLLPLLAEDFRFFVLALSQRSAQLYQCTRYSAVETDLRKAPKGIGELLELNRGEKQLQFHGQGAARPGPRGRAGLYGGHAEDTDEDKENILVYFQTVNRAVNASLSYNGGMLVLAGVDYLTRIYEKANTYPRLCAGRIAGNPAELRPEELKDKAWELIKPEFQQAAGKAVRHFEQLQGTPRASNHLKTILEAGNNGRVGVLLVSAREQRWGFFDDASGVIDVHAKAEPCDLELLELCVTRTLDHGGKVYALEPGQMPGRAPAAAIFRY